MNQIVLTDVMAEPVELGPEAYLSADYAKAEVEKFWRKVWQPACRVEEVSKVGDYSVYDIANDTILIVRSAEDEISAFYNVCAHRGRKLVREGCGHTKQFRCSYHAWRYNLKGENTFILDEEDWEGALPRERVNLPHVKVGTWAGWVWINMDPDAEPLEEYLEPAISMLAPFELDKMRYRWRKWTKFACNWKVALEAFMEPYHVEGTHPQLLKYGSFYVWSQGLGRHGNDGFTEKDADPNADALKGGSMRAGKGDDARQVLADMQAEIWQDMTASTTQTLVDAAARLPSELPEGTPTEEVVKHWMDSARRDDAARGVVWPTVSHEQMAQAGLGWNIFPNLSILIGLTFAQIVRVRPSGLNPDECIYEMQIIERFPEGQEPKVEYEHVDAVTELEKWPRILQQDFFNIADVQTGMKSAGFRGGLPNPKQERKIANFHRNLADYMGVTTVRDITS